MARTLIIGYGNTDRQDDGIAWHVLVGLADRLGYPGPFDPDEGFPPVENNGSTSSDPNLLYVLQLTPDLAETIAQYKRVCFIDAHTGSAPEEIHFIELTSLLQVSPFTHHLTPASCLALSHTLYGATPQAVLYSIRGYEFGFTNQLSARSQRLAPEAIERIMRWIELQ